MRIWMMLLCCFAVPVTGQEKTASNKPRGRVSAPTPARKVSNSRIWSAMGKSRGGRAIEGLKSGKGEFRVLVVGSLAGKDPVASRLVDTLALEVVRNEAILGGFRSTIVRAPNPDGVALRRATNASGVKIATSFVRKTSAPREPETQFLVNLLRDYKPHRVIHVTTGSSASPMVLHNRLAADLASDMAGWIQAARRSANRFSPLGSMEQFVGENAEVITLVLPRATKPTGVLKRYGESLLAILGPSEPMDDWPPPTAWNDDDAGSAKVYRSGKSNVQNQGTGKDR